MMVNVKEAFNINLFFFYQLEQAFPSPVSGSSQKYTARNKGLSLKGLVGGVFLRV